MLLVVIHWVSNSNDIIISPKQLQAAYTESWYREEMIDFIDKNGGLKELYIGWSIFKRTLEQDKSDEECVGVNTHCTMMNDPIYGQISYNCCLWNAFKLKLGQNPKIFLVEMKRATRKVIAKQIIRLLNVILTSRVKARCVQLLFITHWLWKVLNRVKERRKRRMAGQRMILVLM